jgi:IS30 family transposase
VSGHKEFDLVVCKQSVVSVLVGVDRKTRRTWLRRVENREAETIRAALIGIEMNLCPPLRKTLTYDNDPGFQKVFDLEQLIGVENYFCDPYCSWQKGSVENVNQRLRRFFPKGTDLSTVTQARLDEVEAILNARPMDCLGELSPDQCWALEVRAAKMMLH